MGIAKSPSAGEEGDSDLLREVLYVRHYSIAGPDHLAERERIAQEISEIGRRSHTTESDIITYIHLASDRLGLGDPTGARRWRARAGHAAGQRPLPSMAWHMGVYDSGVALLEGQYDEFQRLVDETLELGRRIDSPQAPVCAAAQRAVMSMQKGQPEAAADVIDFQLADSANRKCPKTSTRAPTNLGDTSGARSSDAMRASISAHWSPICFQGSLRSAAANALLGIGLARELLHPLSQELLVCKLVLEDLIET